MAAEPSSSSGDVFAEHGLVDCDLDRHTLASSSAAAASSSRAASIEWISGWATLRPVERYPVVQGVSVAKGKRVRFFYCPGTDQTVRSRFRRQAQIRAVDTLPPPPRSHGGRRAVAGPTPGEKGPPRVSRGCRPPATILAWWEDADGLWCVLDAEHGQEQDLVDAWHHILGDDWPEEQLRAADVSDSARRPSLVKRSKWAAACDLLLAVAEVLHALNARHLSLNWAHPSCFFVRPRTDDEIATGKKPEAYIRRLWGVRPVVGFDLADILHGSPLEKSTLFATDPPDLSWSQLSEDYVFRHLRYLAPETVISRRSTPTNDLYGWGVLAYELLTGTTVDGRPDSIDLADVDALVDIHRHVTIEARPPRDYLKAVADLGAVEADLPPQQLCDIIMHCLAKDPSARYRSFDALFDDLAALAHALRSERDVDGLTIEGGRRKSPGPSSTPDDMETSTSERETADRLQELNNRHGNLEYLTILRASMALGQERDPQILLCTLLRILCQSTRCDYAALSLCDDSSPESLRLRAAGPFERLNAYNVDMQDSAAASLCPTSLMAHVWDTGQSICSPNEFVGLANEGFYSDKRPRTLMCLPVSKYGAQTGVVVLSAMTHAITPAELESAKEVVAAVATFGCVAHSQLSFAERVQAEVDQRTRDLTATIQAKSQFLSRCSHELRSPLSAIMGLAAVLEASPDLSPVQREHLHTITASSEDLMSLISNILDHSKLESRSVTLEEIPLNVRDVVETALDTIAPLAQSKGIELSLVTSFTDDPPGMIGDPFRVKQILINLLSNAVKFTPSDTVSEELGKGAPKVILEYRWEQKDDDQIHVSLDVADTGMGIPKSKLDKLFKSFSQVDETITRSYGGSGLGLVISRDLARLLGGDCTVTSEFGKGSTFTLSFVARRDPKWTQPTWRRFPTPQSCFVLCPLDRPWVELLDNELVALNCKPVRFVDDLKTVMRKDQEDGLNAGRRFAYILVDTTLIDRDVLKRMREVQAEAKFVFLVRSIELSSEMERLSIDRDSIIARPIKFKSLYAMLLPPKPSGRPGQKLSTQMVGRNGTDRNMGKERPLNILIVDDGKVNIQVCRRILELFGYEGVDAASDGRQGIEAAEKKHYDLILLDLQMPGLDGFETLARIRASESTGDPCVVSLSGDVDVATQEKCLDSGFFDCLAKPVDIPRLAQVLRKAYDHKTGDKETEDSRGNRATSPEPGARR